MTKLTDVEKIKQYEKMIERSKKYAERSRVRSMLIVAKAKKSGIVVTEREVDDYIKQMKK